jgi:hypothetical protein
LGKVVGMERFATQSVLPKKKQAEAIIIAHHADEHQEPVETKGWLLTNKVKNLKWRISKRYVVYEHQWMK